MDDRRLLIAIALAGVILFGWQFMLQRTGLERQAAQVQVREQTSTAQAPAQPSAGTLSPNFTPAAPATMSAPAPEQLTSVDTRTWKIVFSSRGARPVDWVLKDYRRGDRHPLELIPDSSGLEALALRHKGAETDFSLATFKLTEDRRDAAARLLTYEIRDTSGTLLRVRYSIPDDGYTCGVTWETENPGPDDRLVVQWRSWKLDTETNSAEDVQHGASDALLGAELSQDFLGGFKKAPSKVHSGSVEWALMRSKYFALGFLFPPQAIGGVTTLGHLDTKQTGVRFEYPWLGKSSIAYEMYVGPVDYQKLNAAGHNLPRLLDVGGLWSFMAPIMTPLSRGLLKFFTLTHRFVPNFGLVIIVLSVALRLVLWPLSNAQMSSMRKMQELQPVMDRLKEKYKNDQERLNKEIFALYKENNVNPFGGCLPLLVQMPVMIALYNLFNGAIELRQAGFFGWITDLSAPDVLATVGGFPLHILPLVMAGTMIWQQKLTPVDPRQATMAYIMPVVMLFIFYRLPSGLVLYWTVTNILTALQQMQNRPRPNPNAAAAVAS